MKLKTILIIAAIVLGTLFSIAGCALTFFSRSGYAETEAVVQKIERVYSHTDSKGRKEYTTKTYIYYNVNDLNYEMQPLGYYDNSFYVGKRIKIYYNVNNPTDIKADTTAFGIFFLIVAAGAFIAAVVIYIKGDALNAIGKNKKQKIHQNE